MAWQHRDHISDGHTHRSVRDCKPLKSDDREQKPYSILFDPLMVPVKPPPSESSECDCNPLFCRHREQTPPARHGGYPGPGQGSPTRHSVDREARSPRSPGRYQPEPGLRTPGSRSRSRGHSRDRNSVHGGRSNRGYSRQGSTKLAK